MQWFSSSFGGGFRFLVLVGVLVLALNRFPSLTAGSECLGGVLSLFSASVLRSS